MGKKSNKRWLVPAVATFLGFVMIMIALATTMMARWSELESVSASGAERAFAEARALAGGEIPYLTISRTHQVTVHRQLEGPAPVSLKALHLLAWDPSRGRLLRIHFPYWFVRLKMSKTLNLGTLTSVLARDWQNLDLRVAEEDLQRRGPGLILDVVSPEGARLLLWTE